ncbi:MAG: AmmeMemoRadiSam system protein B [Chlamydiota bacterium]|nr:AmmeMemoRadiSam system protein B [Chlamydiota bacterium]
MKLIRPMSVAGSFYPREPEQLRKMILDFNKNVPDPVGESSVLALIVPHAGYIYSGQTAAYVYKRLSPDAFDSIILIGPNHHGSGKGGTSIYVKGAFETPLGNINVDEALASRILSGCPGANADLRSHECEHSLEVQLPFLQIVLHEFSIVPIVMSDYSRQACELLSESIAQAIKNIAPKKVLIIASTDLSHYHHAKEAKKMDETAIRWIVKMDESQLLKSAQQEHQCELCGLGPAVVAIRAAKKLGAKTCDKLHYTHSGEVSGDNDNVVGYVSGIIY